MDEPRDVCVIGSGAGGAPLALELARAGMHVVVLEKGAWYRSHDLVHDELRVVRRNFFVPFVADEPHVFRRTEEESGQRTNFGWISCCVGGGTVHWAGYAYRLAPSDFRRAAETGGMKGTSLADWPIGYEELEPYYAKAEREIGVSGAPAASPEEPPRSSPYPLSPVRSHPIAKALETAAEFLELHTDVTPRAILSAPYQGRASCLYCDFCASYGCEIGAKGSTADALLPRAILTGKCEVKERAMAKEIRVDARGRAKSVVYVDASGIEREQSARIIIVSCSAVESPRLLLSSRSSLFPDGLANACGLVGRNLMFLTRGGGSADFLYDGRAKIEGLRARDPFIGLSVRDLYRTAGMLSFDFVPESPIFVAEKLSAAPDGRTLWGSALKQRLKQYYREGKHVEFEAYSECLPKEMNAVDLSPDVRDRFGLPAARITFERHEDDRKRSEKLVDAGVDLLQAMEPDRIGEPVSGATFDVLQSGTCRFGSDPNRSVLDRDCRAHDVPNLYVVDGSFMPTSGAAPNTLTIMANAFRVADAIIARGKRGEL